jgi:hypothetical protein
MLTYADVCGRFTQVPKAELLQRLFASGRGFKRILYASFLQVC